MLNMPIPIAIKTSRILDEWASCVCEDVSEEDNTIIMKCNQNISVHLINHQ
jgi:hypothetical protein